MMETKITWLGSFTPRVSSRRALWTVLTIFWKKILQDPLFVPETIFVDDLLKKNCEIPKTNGNLAGWIRWDGWFGILEDLLEEIVGEIDDETDKAEIEVHQTEKILISFKVPWISMILIATWCWAGKSDDVDTIAGYYLTELGVFQRLRTSLWIGQPNKQLILTNDSENGR